MALHEADREDLMRDATALKVRAKLTVPHESQAVVAGFGPDGSSLSIYFGPDPVYRFDSHGRLRRGYVGGHLFRTQGRTLARLTRRRDQRGTQLSRHDLTPSERDEFLDEMLQRLQNLAHALTNNIATVLEQLPAYPSILPKLSQVLEMILQVEERLAPAIKG